MSARPEIRRVAWPNALAVLGLLLAAVLVLYRDTAVAMVTIWARSDTFAHAFIVPPLVAWLIWRKRAALAAQRPSPAPWLLLPIAVAAAGWLLGDLAAANAVSQLAFTALLVLAVIATIGLRAGRVIAFPLVFLFFAVPIGEFVMPQMMQWTADFTVLALRASGIPVYREGLQFVIPSGNWSVVEACSGIRYLIASVMVGVLFAYLNYRSLRQRLIFTAISILVPIVANWVRAYLIVLIGHLSGNRLAVGADHLIYGWVFFGVVITLMLMIAARWREANASDQPRTSTESVPIAARTGWRVGAVAAGALALFILPHLVLWGLIRGEREDAPTLAVPTSLGDGWYGADSGWPLWKPAFTGAQAEFNGLYSKNQSAKNQSGNGQSPVGLYLGYYGRQAYDRKLVSSENTVVTLHDPAWSIIETGRRKIDVDATSTVWRSTRLRASAHVAADTSVHRLVWQIYWVNGILTSDEAWAKLCTAFYRLAGRGNAAVIVIYTDDFEDGSADARLASFLDANLPALTKVLARVSDEKPAVAMKSVATDRVSGVRS